MALEMYPDHIKGGVRPCAQGGSSGLTYRWGSRTALAEWQYGGPSLSANIMLSKVMSLQDGKLTCETHNALHGDIHCLRDKDYVCTVQLSIGSTVLMPLVGLPADYLKGRTQVLSTHILDMPRLRTSIYVL